MAPIAGAHGQRHDMESELEGLFASFSHASRTRGDRGLGGLFEALASLERSPFGARASRASHG